MSAKPGNDEEPSVIEWVADHVFIERLAAQVRAGYGLVPFIGSGCSSASGILMGEQFTDYLAWTVCICVADPKKWPGRRERWDLRLDGWPPLPTASEVRLARAWALSIFRELAERCDLIVDDNPLTHRVRGLRQASGTMTPDFFATLLYAPFVPPFLREETARADPLMDARHLRQFHSLLGGRGIVEGGLVRPEISPTSVDAIVERAIRSLYDWRATLHFLAELQLADRETLFLVEPDPAVIDSFN